MDQHPYLLIYLLGSGLVLFLSAFNMALGWLLAWMTKGNVVAKNLRKLEAPDDETIGVKALTYAAMLVFEAALSWVGVAAGIWQTMSIVLKAIREALASTPEAIKILRFPLQTNPDMSREAVWAHVSALGVRVGNSQPSARELLSSLGSVRENHPSFDRLKALTDLKGLNVVNDEAVSSALRLLDSGDVDEET